MPIPQHVSKSLRVSAASVRTRMPDIPANVSESQISDALATVDQEAIYDNIRNGLSVSVWDRVSPINGVPAEHFLAREDVSDDPESDIILLKEGDRVVYFQPHDPEASGLTPIPKGKGLTMGNRQADKLSADAAAMQVLRQVRTKLNLPV